jgi:hypothetical protein
VIAGRHCRVPDDPGRASAVRAWQGLAAGLVTGGVGALFVTAAGAGTTALLIRSAGFRGWVYHGQHLTASATYGRELYASQFVTGYGAVCVIFPVITLLMAMAGAGYAKVAGARPGDDPPRRV